MRGSLMPYTAVPIALVPQDVRFSSKRDWFNAPTSCDGLLSVHKASYLQRRRHSARHSWNASTGSGTCAELGASACLHAHPHCTASIPSLASISCQQQRQRKSLLVSAHSHSGSKSLQKCILHHAQHLGSMSAMGLVWGCAMYAGMLNSWPEDVAASKHCFLSMAAAHDFWQRART